MPHNTPCKYLVGSLLVAAIFILMLLWYISGAWYPGPFLFGVVAGITCIAEAILFVCALRICRRTGIHAVPIATILISLSVAIISCYCFIIWVLFLP